MMQSRDLSWDMAISVAGIAWIGGFLAGTWVFRGNSVLELFGLAFFPLFSILSARSFARKISRHENPPDNAFRSDLTSKNF